MGRMVTTGAKWFFGLATLGLLAAVVYGWGSRGGLTGSATGGLVRGVGEHAGYTVLAFMALAAAGLGAVIVAVRDADAEALTAVSPAETVPEAAPPASASYWPAIAALGAGVAVIGLAVGSLLFVIGMFVVGIALVEWTVQAWADRATGDPEANRQIRNRFMHPIEFPVAGALAIGVVVLSVSRVLLAISATAASAAAIVFATAVLVTAGLLAWRPQLKRTVVAAIVALFAVVVLAGGIIAAANGSRSFEEHHEDEHVEEESP